MNTFTFKNLVLIFIYVILKLVFITSSPQPSKVSDIKSKNSLFIKDKKIRLNACMKLSRIREKEDTIFYNNLLKLVDAFEPLLTEEQYESGMKPPIKNSVNDFIAFTIVTCYSHISDTQAVYINEGNEISSLEDEYKNLLKLEKWYELYNTNNGQEIENEILKLQEKVLEVVSLSKEEDIKETKYYNIKEKNREEESILNKLSGYFPANSIELSFNNLLIFIAITIGFYAIFKRKEDKTIKKTKNEEKNLNKSLQTSLKKNN